MFCAADVFCVGDRRPAAARAASHPVQGALVTGLVDGVVHGCASSLSCLQSHPAHVHLHWRCDMRRCMPLHPCMCMHPCMHTRIFLLHPHLQLHRTHVCAATCFLSSTLCSEQRHTHTHAHTQIARSSGHRWHRSRISSEPHAAGPSVHLQGPGGREQREARHTSVRCVTPRCLG